MEHEPILPSPVESQGQTDSSSDAESSVGGNIKAEKIGVAQERSGNQAQPQSLPLQTVVPLPQDDSTNTGQAQSQPQGNGPTIADDVDVIEKEWVDKAKSIVSSTKDNPHMQEKEVSKLQADYLMKRYGKKMKTVE